MTFVYTTHRRGRTVTVAAAGEIDVAAAWPFGAALCQVAESEPTDLIEVDLSELEFIDSTGVAALKRAYRTTARHGCRLVVTNATGIVLRVLQLADSLAHLSPAPRRPTNAGRSARPDANLGRAGSRADSHLGPVTG